MGHALNHLKNDPTVTLEGIEDTMIAFGYELWPWNQAFREFMLLTEEEIGEHFLMPRLSKKIEKKYHDFKQYGGTFRDLYAGQPAHFFTLEERGDLCEALIGMRTDLREYVRRDIISLNQKRYLTRVEEFKKLLGDIKQTLDHLRDLAQREQDHPSLASEIRSRVRHFEHGLCLLAPDIEYEAVCQSVGFFKGRKQELNHLKGIHTSKTLTLV